MVVVVVDKVQNLLLNAVVSSCLNLLGARERKKTICDGANDALGFGHQIKIKKTINRLSGGISNQAMRDSEQSNNGLGQGSEEKRVSTSGKKLRIKD